MAAIPTVEETLSKLDEAQLLIIAGSGGPNAMIALQLAIAKGFVEAPNTTTAPEKAPTLTLPSAPSAGLDLAGILDLATGVPTMKAPTANALPVAPTATPNPHPPIVSPTPGVAASSPGGAGQSAATPQAVNPIDQFVQSLAGLEAPQSQKPNINLSPVAPRPGGQTNPQAMQAIMQILMGSQQQQPSLPPSIGALMGRGGF